MRILVLLTLIISSTAFACPNLSGVYETCKQTSDGEISAGLSMSQKVQNGIMIYESISEKGNDLLIADGKIREKTEEDGYQTQNKVYCSGNKLILETVFSSGDINGSGITITQKSRDEARLNNQREC